VSAISNVSYDEYLFVRFSEVLNNKSQTIFLHGRDRFASVVPCALACAVAVWLCSPKKSKKIE
jgi:hypothetical protein